MFFSVVPPVIGVTRKWHFFPVWKMCRSSMIEQKKSNIIKTVCSRCRGHKPSRGEREQGFLSERNNLPQNATFNYLRLWAASHSAVERDAASAALPLKVLPASEQLPSLTCDYRTGAGLSGAFLFFEIRGHNKPRRRPWEPNACARDDDAPSPGCSRQGQKVSTLSIEALY